eukprot:337299-Amphidinium_carterae.2
MCCYMLQSQAVKHTQSRDERYYCILLEATELNNFRFYTQSCSQAGTATLDTKQYYKWKEDINRHESENGQGTINDHVNIATVVNNLKGNIAQNLMMRIN